VFTARELAIAVPVITFISVMLVHHRDVSIGARRVMAAVFHPLILVPLTLYLGYFALVVWDASFLGIWSGALLGPTIVCFSRLQAFPRS
jgi:hypothetical protein